MSDQARDDLDRAREHVDALAQHVDLVTARRQILARLARRRRAASSAKVAIALITTAAILAGIALALRSDHKETTVEVQPPRATAADCVAPSLPAPGEQSSAPIDSLRGGAVVAPFELDGGRFRVSPPDPAAKPAVSANHAECAALASLDAYGTALQVLASEDGGVAIGYGLVTIDRSLVAAAHKGQLFPSQVNSNTHPVLPDPTSYEQRLAWLVVFRDMPTFHRGTSGASSARTTPPQKAGHDNVVFVIDAQTGADALLYTEAAIAPSQAAVIVPAELVSVPWTLVSRAAGGYSGTLSATILPCDGYPNPVSVESGQATVAVVVERPVGASCGVPKQVTLTLHAATVTGDLPQQLDHAPLGPYILPPSTGLNRAPSDHERSLLNLSDSDNGRTVQITVGSVVAVTPLMQVNHDAPSQVASSNSSVVGPLDPASSSPVGEFRAWRVGRADLSVPTSACHYPTSDGLPCTSPWIVHVVVE